MSARNFYIMQSAVEPMQSELPCYTPLTNHATDVHVVPMVFASDYKALHTTNHKLREELKAWMNAEAEKGTELVKLRTDYAALEAELMQSESRLHEVAVVCATTEQERDAAQAECERLRGALQQADDYLSHNKLNEIGSGSILHRAMQTALSPQP